MEVRLFVSPLCFMCKIVGPLVRLWFLKRGIQLDIYKISRGIAKQVNGNKRIQVSEEDVPMTPALQVGSVVLIGTGILDWLLKASGRK